MCLCIFVFVHVVPSFVCVSLTLYVQRRMFTLVGPRFSTFPFYQYSLLEILMFNELTTLFQFSPALPLQSISSRLKFQIFSLR